MGPYCPAAAATAGRLLHEHQRHVDRQPAERDAAAALVGFAHEHDTVRRQFDLVGRRPSRLGPASVGQMY